MKLEDSTLSSLTRSDSNPEEPERESFPDSSNDTLIHQLKNLSHAKLKEIITNQIDLEIQLKHRELNMNEHEIGKIESQMLVLRKFFEISKNKKFDNEPREFTRKYFELLDKSFNSTYNNIKQVLEAGPPQIGSKYINDPMFASSSSSTAGHSYRTRSTTSSLRPSATSVTTGVRNPSLGCLYRRTDGVVVRLTCPTCQRSNFSSAQGFLNHSRIAHTKEYTSQDAAALKCGEIIPEVKQDPTGEASIKILTEKGLDPNRHLNVNDYLFGGINMNSNTTTSTTLTGDSPKPETLPNEGGSPKEQNGPFIEQSNELLKKLVKEGKMKKEEYELLLKQTKAPTANSHLFDDEVEMDDSDESSLSTNPSFSNLANLHERKRRQSRGGINISVSKNPKDDNDDDDDDDEQEEEEEQQPVEKKRKR
ncbi:AHC1 Protein AHC1 [Candida maltosa Xu316]